jgi:hypothetical protein
MGWTFAVHPLKSFAVATKKLSVGVTAALIGGIAVIIAAIIPFGIHKDGMPTQSISNGNGNIQAGRDVNIQSTDKADEIQKFNDEFEKMTVKRQRAGIVCLEYLSKTNWNLVTNNTDGLDDVLNFFDGLGYALQSQRVSTNDVYEYFSDDILAYYQTCEDRIHIIQSNDDTELPHLTQLYETMRIETAAQPPADTVTDVYFEKPGLIKLFQSETNSVTLREN